MTCSSWPGAWPGMMDNEQPHQELVKCVVVGDTAVGKTRLICARACNKHVSLSQLLTTHVPTVWAIDQYRIYKDVLERSWEVVDSVNVSLRLWDTFGDHEKDRRFAYGRSDVVLLCFSVGSAASLRHCKAMWYPEIRRFCPQTPILLVGCKNDLRYMYRDETYLSFCRDRSPFVRPTRACDLVLPEQARAVAKELGLAYYETSVLSYHGVNEAFENAIRAALVARRQQRFWMTNLKRVRRPLLQAPFCPPAPPPPTLHVCGPLLEDHLHALWVQQAHTDVVLVAGGVGFSAHRFLLAAASPALQRLLTMDLSAHLGGLHRSPSTPSLTSESTSEDIDDDMDHRWLLKSEVSCGGGKERWSEEALGAGSKTLRFWEQLKSRMGCLAGADSGRRPGVYRELDHPAFRSIRLERRSGPEPKGRPTASLQTVVTLSKLVTAQAMRQCLQFLYTGNLEARFCELQTVPLGLLLEIRQAAEFIDLPELLMFVTNVQAHEEFLNTELRQRYRQVLRNRLQELCLEQGLFSDVLFQLDDGVCAAHRPLLMAACDVMKAMFSGHFRESSAKVVVFPGVREETFRHLLCYLYTDRCPGVTPGSCLALLELANRLCLPRLVQLVEEKVVQDLQIAADKGGGGEVVEECLRLLEPCQIHNAEQLAEWCIHHLATNYNAICKRSPKLLRSLHPENQAYLNEHRWPPVWYLKDYDYYLKCLLEREKEENKKPLKRSRNNSGCLCFTGKSRRDESSQSSTYHAV